MKRWIWFFGVMLACGAVVVVIRTSTIRAAPIALGILQSTTGTMAISERPLVDAANMAVDELNRAGGVLGRPVHAIIADGKSDPAAFASEAEHLIDQGVSAIVGCWTSASRKAVKPVVERRDHLLFYPLQYEGLEMSPNIVYLGAAPNQQIIPAVKWAFGTLGHRMFLVGSDYVFPRAANAIIRDYMREWHGQILAEAYLPLGSRDVDGVVAEIKRLRPDVIVNTLNGDSNVAFFTKLRAAGITAAMMPTLSFSVAEEELRAMPAGLMTGDYTAWTYFQSVPIRSNEQFVRAFKQRYGDDRVTSDPIEAAYVAVKLWASAVERAGTSDPRAVRAAVIDRSFRAPEGMIYVDGETQHTWKQVRIGKAGADGQFAIVWASGEPIRPVPYPEQRTRAQWDAFEMGLFKRWGNQWVAPSQTASFFYADPESTSRFANAGR